MIIKKKLNSVGVIGRGKWGKKIIKVLKKHSSLKYVIGSNINYKKCSTKIDWVFILTPNKTHYKICEFFLKNKINVFCEKPLTLNYQEAVNLYKLAEINKVNLYVDDIEIYKNKKIKLKKKNDIIRQKKDVGKNYSLFERLFYHDLYLIFKYLKNKNVTGIKFINNSNLFFNIDFDKISINFFYSIKSKNKIHRINKINLLSFKTNPIDKMISYIFKNKNFIENKKRSLFALKLMLKIRSQYKKIK